MSKGGARQGAGRKKGGMNQITREVKALAEQHAPEAIEQLARLMKESDSEKIQVVAANAILDRAVGKPKQETSLAHSGNPENPLIPKTSKKDLARAMAAILSKKEN